MPGFPALLDANVLVPMSLADTLLCIAEREIFVPLWSIRILRETKLAVLHVHPEIPETAIDHRIAQMSAAFEEATVTGSEPLESKIDLPDPNDRHVVAAAIRGGAQCIVTSNLADFPPDKLAPYDIEVKSPDDFLLDEFDLDVIIQVVLGS